MTDADIISYVIADITLSLSLCSSLCFVLCDASPQGEASQHSPTGGRLRDQKRVLPLPWTVSADVWWAGGKRSLHVFVVARACCTVLHVLIIQYTRGEWAVVAWGPERRYENSAELHSFGIQIWMLASCSILISMCSWGILMHFHGYSKCTILISSFGDTTFASLGILVGKKMIKHKRNIYGEMIKTISPLTGGCCVILSKTVILGKIY